MAVEVVDELEIIDVERDEHGGTLARRLVPRRERAVDAEAIVDVREAVVIRHAVHARQRVFERARHFFDEARERADLVVRVDGDLDVEVARTSGCTASAACTTAYTPAAPIVRPRSVSDPRQSAKIFPRKPCSTSNIAVAFLFKRFLL